MTNSSSTAVSYSGLITLGAASSIVASAGDININSGTITGATFGLTLGGTGNGSVSSIIGSGTVTKSGTGTWTLSGANTYTGLTTISAGTLKLNNTAALGTAASGTSITSGAVLDLNGINYSTAEALTVNGTGISSGGAVINSSSTGATFAGLIRLGSASSIVGGTGTINISNAGTITGATFGLTLGGAAGGTLTSILGTTTGTLTKADGGTWTLSGANTFTGGTTLNAGTLNINNASTLGTSAGTFTIAGGTIDATVSGISTVAYPLALNADFSFTGTNSLNLGTGTVTMNADRQITVTNNTLTIGGAISQGTRSLTKAGSGTLSFGSQAVTLNGLTISAGTLTSTSGTMNLAGNFSNSGTFTHNSGTVTFNGTSAQTIGGSSGTTFNNLTTNNSAGVTLDGADATVNTTLAFTNGKITTSTNKVILGSSGTLSGAAAGKYVYGTFRRFIPATLNFSADFAIGDANNYTPVTILFSGTPGGSSSLDASTTVAAPPVASGLSQTKYINRKWTVINNGVTGFSSYSPTFTFVDGDKIGTPNTSALVIRKLSGSTWSTTTIGARTSTSTQATGLTSFSDFAIGEQQLDHFALSLSTPQTNGVAFTGTNTLTAQDVLNVTVSFDASVNNVTIAANAPLTGAVSGLSGGNKLTSASDFSAGVANLTARGMVYTGNAATGTFTATSADSKTGTSGSVQINAGTVAKLIVTLPGETFTSGVGNSGTVTAQTAGTAFNITLMAVDASNNTDVSYSGTKTISYSGPGGSPTYTTSVTFTNGQATSVSTTLTKAETTTITATDGSLTGVASSSLTVNAGVLNNFLVEAACGGGIAPQTADTAFDIKITARDAYKNTVTGFSGTVKIGSSGDLSGAPVTSGSFVGGVLASHSVTITSAQSGTTLSVTESVSGANGSSNGFTVNPAGVNFLVEASGGGDIGPQTVGAAFWDQDHSA